MTDRQSSARLKGALVELLTGSSAHAGFDHALRGLRRENRWRSPGRGLRSVWQLVEHMRIAQQDILRYTLDAGWRSPEWPSGYWPSRRRPTEAEWRASLGGFRSDRAELVALVEDPARDLLALIPHGEGRTYLRQVLLAADHNSHHLAQVISARRLLGDWAG